MERTAIVLAGGFSSRLGQDKGLVLLANRPLVKHVLDRTSGLVEERLVIVSSKEQAERYSQVLGEDVDIVSDSCEAHGPLVGAATGLQRASGKYSILLPCDTPFVSKDILQLILELCINKNAAIPRWPNCYIEPLQAVYQTKPALEAAQNAMCSGSLNLQAMVEMLRNVRYVSTLVLEELDPGLKTFSNINNIDELRKAEAALTRRQTR